MSTKPSTPWADGEEAFKAYMTDSIIESVKAAEKLYVFSQSLSTNSAVPPLALAGALIAQCSNYREPPNEEIRKCTLDAVNIMFDALTILWEQMPEEYQKEYTNVEN